MQSQVTIAPAEVAYLFIDGEKTPGIIPLEEQMSIGAGDKIATQIDGVTMFGRTLWQGRNNLCWVCELTGDGHSWAIRVVRCCEMMQITPLEYSLAIGMSKMTNVVKAPDVENRLQETSVRVARMNNLGNAKNRCEKCEIPMTALVTRAVITQMVVVDKSNPDRVRLGEAQDMTDRVEDVHLYCPSCQDRVELDWSKVEIVDD